MGSHHILLIAVATATLASVSSRAVNISNTWVLPEEGFPVFYRYFRDRISWYEADAVCQFHHANLVTVDSASQFDAVRAYLKELDIIKNIWIGLSRSSETSSFSWTDFQPLSNEGHWQEAIPTGNNPLCTVMDPAADFRWHALTCGGPEVASFICELPVPSWAMSPGGCLLTELPSLTVLYIPEQSALELTSDCGLDGTRRIVCKGNANREDMLRQLSCGITNDDFEEKPTRESPLASTELISTKTNLPDLQRTTKSWTSNTIGNNDFDSPTRHRRETDNTINPVSTKSTRDMIAINSSGRMDATTIKPPQTNSVNTANIVNPNKVLRSDKSAELTTTTIRDLTTYEPSSQPEEQAETFGTATATTESKSADVEQEYVGEYPSVINQGQLFSIIENGTMFDIIELNETGTEVGNVAKDKSFTPSHIANKFTTSSPLINTHTAEHLYTTVIYNKEPTEDATFITNRDLQTGDKEAKKDTTPTLNTFETFKSSFVDKVLQKPKTVNDISNKDDDKTLSKEMEMFPIIGNSLMKLNRTNRKELPMIENNFTKGNEENNFEIDGDFVPPTPEPSFLEADNDFTISGSNGSSHKIVEIKLHKDGKESEHKLFITTKAKKSDKKFDKVVGNDKKINQTENVSNAETRKYSTNSQRKQNSTVKNDNGLEAPDMSNINSRSNNISDEQRDVIDPKLDKLNSNVTKNDDSEIIPAVVERVEDLPLEDMLMKEHFLPKSLLGFDLKEKESSEEDSATHTDFIVPTDSGGYMTGEPLQSEPQPRPNRQRQLTRPQRRSFYPYFFSRVLG